MRKGERTLGRDADKGGPARLESGSWVDHFQIRRLVGEGSRGRVYLARDAVLGRRVALKLLDTRGAHADAPALLEEARAIARLNHPNIVTIYEVGHFEGASYLALEYIDGESLKDRLQQRRPSMASARRWAADIARALAHAHAQGILHCDLKPGNVMMTREGTPKLVDFDLAGDAGKPSWGGTPGYMAPEQWCDEAVSAATDVWAWGVVTFELLTGARPLPESTPPVALVVGAPPRPDVPGLSPALADLVARCLSLAPEARPTLDEIRTALETDERPEAQVSPDLCPFRGLAAFSERDAPFYFGRELEAQAFVERLQEQPVIAVVGPSGAGKSSFVSAGVIPRLRERGPLKVIRIRPGRAPFAALAHRLAEDRADAEVLAARWRTHPARVSLELLEAARRHDATVLLFVDQLEELFTLTEGSETQDRFVQLLFEAARDAPEPVRVVFTVREDFMGRLPSVEQVAVVRPLSPPDLRRVVQAPLDRLGYRFDDPRVLDEMLAAVSTEATALPLLQFTLRVLWEGRDEQQRTLRAQDYRRIGGVEGALATHGDAVLAAMSDAERRAARRILLELVSPSLTRRVLQRGDLLEGEGAEAALGRLVAARLVTTRRGGVDEAGGLVELAHESLIERWTVLARWLEETHEDRALVEEVEAAARLWHQRGRPRSEVWTAEPLQQTRARLRGRDVSMSAQAQRFLEAGAAEQARLQRRRRTVLATAALTLLGITAGAVALAVEFRRQEQVTRRNAARLQAAAADLGRFELDLRPFDLDDASAARLVRADELVALDFTLHRAAPDATAAPLPAHAWRRTRLAGSSTTARWSVEAPAGAATLRVRGRHRPGEVPCPDAVLPLARLPGYADREVATRVTVRVPTCRASAHDMVRVPAGPFVGARRGQQVYLPGFTIDRTEVDNRAYRILEGMADITGLPRVGHPKFDRLEIGTRPNHPATGVDLHMARAFCRFFGKDLPTVEQWTKAARGGLHLDAGGRVANPWPRRAYPWGPKMDRRRVNLVGPEDGHPWTAPVDSMPEGASPYGVLHLAGNVSEWTRSVESEDRTLYAIRGAHAESPEDQGLHAIDLINTRNPRTFHFGLGFRCVGGAEQ